MSDYFKVSQYVKNNNFAQPMDTIVPTPNGDYYLGNLTVGDYLFDRIGNPTQITDVYYRGQLKAFKVNLSDGRSTICAEDHLWTYFDMHERVHTDTLKNMIDRGILNNRGRARYKIPNNYPVMYSEKIYYIDPYVVGVFLGDGCCLENILSVSNPEVDIVNEVARLLDSEYKKNSISNYTWNFRNKSNNSPLHSKDIFKYYENYLIQYSYNKRIPYFYMLGSIQQRYNLLQGLMDTDGSIGYNDNGRFNVRYSTTSYYLAMDIMQLAYSLGLSVSILEDKRSLKYTTESCYSITFRIPNEIKPMLFRKCKKKCDIASESLKYTKPRKYDRNIITSVDDLGYCTDMMCVSVNNPENLYLTNNFIVTHNCNFNT